MTPPDETPPPPAPMYYPEPMQQQPMLSVTPGGPIPRWIIVLAVGYGVVTLLFFVAYAAFLVWSFNTEYDDDSSGQHIGGVHASLDPAVTE